MATINEQLAGLATLSPAQLRAEWRRVFRAAPPRLTADLLRRGIAYRLQARAHGGLDAVVRRQLDRMARRAAAGRDEAPPTDVQLKPGTRLVRSWNGTTYSVLVTREGLAMGDRQFTSLSQVAHAITGTHWSGPRFFGIKPAARTTGAAARSAVRRTDARTAATGG